MATKVYGSSVLPSDTVSVLAGDTLAISLGFNSSVGLIGNMNVSAGNATAGEVVEVTSGNDARKKFGDDSELHRAVEVAYANGVAQVYAIGVTENTASETFGSTTATSSGTLANTPAADPTVAREHEIKFTDINSGTVLTTNIVYGSVTAPSTADTVNVNPKTGEWKADATAEYTAEYTHGDYGPAITNMADENVRAVGLLHEDTGLANSLLSDLSNEANSYKFKRGVWGADASVDGSNVGGYSSGVADQRMVEVAPARSSTGKGEVRTVAAVAAKVASMELGTAAFGYQNGALGGLTDLGVRMSDQDLATLANDKQVLPVKYGRSIHIAKDVTTSTDDRFSRIHVVEVVDEAVLTSHLISRNYVADGLTDETLGDIEDDHRTAFDDMTNDTPPMLDGYSVDATEGSSVGEVDVEIGLDPVNAIDVIDVSMTVGEVKSTAELGATL